MLATPVNLVGASLTDKPDVPVSKDSTLPLEVPRPVGPRLARESDEILVPGTKTWYDNMQIGPHDWPIDPNTGDEVTPEVFEIYARETRVQECAVQEARLLEKRNLSIKNARRNGNYFDELAARVLYNWAFRETVPGLAGDDYVDERDPDKRVDEVAESYQPLIPLTYMPVPDGIMIGTDFLVTYNGRKLIVDGQLVEIPSRIEETDHLVHDLAGIASNLYGIRHDSVRPLAGFMFVWFLTKKPREDLCVMFKNPMQVLAFFAAKKCRRQVLTFTKAELEQMSTDEFED
jgi:hypothetical protein